MKPKSSWGDYAIQSVIALIVIGILGIGMHFSNYSIINTSVTHKFHFVINTNVVCYNITNSVLLYIDSNLRYRLCMRQGDRKALD